MNPTATPPTLLAPSRETLDANLAAIAIRSPRAAQAISECACSPEITFEAAANEDAITATLDSRPLASRRRPLEEASRLAATANLDEAGAIVVLGFALGHHLAALAQRTQDVSTIIAFEPDIPLLRAVFERIDHSGWIRTSGLTLFTEPDQPALVSEGLRGLEGPLAVGVEFLEHPPSRMRLGAGASTFSKTFTDVFKSIRTHIITTMVQTDVTVRNELMNITDYAASPGIADLAGIARDRPAIVVSAGPSLQRNIHLLQTPGVRDRCVIIAVQTVLKQLLSLGIKPHFVTAIDYHEISKRFYEGLTADDVRETTLIAEARANPAILDAYPGPMRIPQDDFLTHTLSWEERESRGQFTPAATVAHLAYYVARHLAADPVILIGQDLAFTDGQYYAAGAAIHDIWAPELNTFNTLEMMEWQRIVRTRGTLREATDHLGRRIYTDEQMATYLAQFERDFLPDTEKGLTIIDATEGGVAKQHTQAMTLAEALQKHAPASAPTLPAFPMPDQVEAADTDEVRKTLGEVGADVRRIARLSREARDLLHKMKRTQQDTARTNRLIEQVHEIRDDVQSLRPAYDLVMKLNQMGALKRFKADRAIKLADSLSELDRQSRQIERDAANLGWIADYADLLDHYLDIAEQTFEGHPKLTRDVLPQGDESDKRPGDAGIGRAAAPTSTTTAVLPIFGEQAQRACEHFCGKPILYRTLARLDQCARLRSITILTDNRAAIETLLAGTQSRLSVDIVDCPSFDRTRAQSIAAGRAWAGSSWRGGLAGLTVFDESLDPAAAFRAIDKSDADSALILGADWCLFDPAIADEVIDRHAECPEGAPLTFTQAPPGLAPAVVSRDLLADLADGQRDGNPFTTLGAVLGYIPTRPRSDPIAKPCCVQIDPELRSTLQRFIPDNAATLAQLEAALRPHGEAIDQASAGRVTKAWREYERTHTSPEPIEFTVKLTSDPGSVERHISEIARANPAARLTLTGALDQRDTVCLLHHAKAAGISFVHLRTDLRCDSATLEALIESPVDVISVDVLAHRAETYRQLTGVDGYATVIENLDRLLKARTIAGGLPTPWVVPRITRRDAVYDEIEIFFDKWTLLAGAAIIDPLAEPIPGERIEPLTLPASVRALDERTRATISEANES